MIVQVLRDLALFQGSQLNFFTSRCCLQFLPALFQEPMAGFVLLWPCCSIRRRRWVFARCPK